MNLPQGLEAGVPERVDRAMIVAMSVCVPSILSTHDVRRSRVRVAPDACWVVDDILAEDKVRDGRVLVFGPPIQEVSHDGS